MSDETPRIASRSTSSATRIASSIAVPVAERYPTEVVRSHAENYRSAIGAQYFYDDDDEMMVMTIANADDCIGCVSCARVCPKNCHTHEALAG